MRSLKNAELAVFENMRWLDRLAWFGLLSTVTIVVSKLIGEPTFGWAGVSVPIDYIAVFYVVLTIVHLFVTILTIRSFKYIWKNSGKEDRLDIFERVIATGSFMTRGILVRENSFLSENNSPSDGILYVDYYLSPGDPPVWVNTLFMVFVVIAIVPFELSLNAFLFYLFAISIVIINWNIGSHWMIALSDLSLERDGSIYFGRISGKGVRTIMSMSGIITFSGTKNYLSLIPYIIFSTILLSLLFGIFVIPFLIAIYWIVP